MNNFPQKEVEAYITRFINERSAPPVSVVGFSKWISSGDSNQDNSHDSTATVSRGGLTGLITVRYEVCSNRKQFSMNGMTVTVLPDRVETWTTSIANVWVNIVLPSNLASVKILCSQY